MSEYSRAISGDAPDSEYIVSGSIWPLDGRPAPDLASIESVFAEFDAVHPGAREALGRTVIPNPADGSWEEV